MELPCRWKSSSRDSGLVMHWYLGTAWDTDLDDHQNFLSVLALLFCLTTLVFHYSPAFMWKKTWVTLSSFWSSCHPQRWLVGSHSHSLRRDWAEPSLCQVTALGLWVEFGLPSPNMAAWGALWRSGRKLLKRRAGFWAQQTRQRMSNRIRRKQPTFKTDLLGSCWES